MTDSNKNSFFSHQLNNISIRGIRTLDFSRKTTNAVLSDLQIVDVIK